MNINVITKTQLNNFYDQMVGLRDDLLIAYLTAHTDESFDVVGELFELDGQEVSRIARERGLFRKRGKGSSAFKKKSTT